MVPVPSLSHFIWQSDELIGSKKMEDPLNVVSLYVQNHLSSDTLDYSFIKNEMLWQGHD